MATLLFFAANCRDVFHSRIRAECRVPYMYFLLTYIEYIQVLFREVVIILILYKYK